MKRSGHILDKTLSVKQLLAVPLMLLMLVMDMPLLLAESTASVKVPAITPAGQSPVSGESVFGVVFSLIIVIVVIFMLAWVMRRMSGASTRSNAMMKVVGGLSMGTRDRVVLIQVGDEQLLLGVSPGRIQTLHKLDKPLQMSDSADMNAGSFSDRLKTMMNKEK